MWVHTLTSTGTIKNLCAGGGYINLSLRTFKSEGEFRDFTPHRAGLF
jgi:hypothetical protein